MIKERRKNKRRYFRIEYPLSYRPKVVIGREEHHVIDISEGGIKFYNKGGKLEVGTEVYPELIFHDNTGIGNLKGKVLRVEENHVVISLSDKIPLERIVEQQRYIIKNYKHIDDYQPIGCRTNKGFPSL